MSIAVSTVVRPSRLLFAMTALMGFGAAAVVALIGARYLQGFASCLRPLPAAAGFFLAVFGFYHGIRCRKPIHIDISGDGLFRLRQLEVMRSCANRNRPHLRGNMEVVRLLKDSTIWPHLLLLRLQGDDGNRTVLPILPDCVSRDSFRALSAACRWMAAHADGRGRENSKNMFELD